MRLTIAMALCAAWPAFASEEWVNLRDHDIRAALTGKTLDYGSAWQDFRPSGRTLYNAGADSWGTWTVRGDEYCSQWPPNASWACYGVDLSADGTKVRFRGLGDDVSTGTFRIAK